jgi:hypothetical protein
MQWLARLNRPWIHFILLGFLLFMLQGMVFPEPKPVVGPISEARTQALVEQWFKATGRPPSEEQVARMIAAELDRDVLFQRALELDLHLYDPVVYQRLLRNMGFLQLAADKNDQELYEQALEMRLHLGDEVIKRRLIQVMEQLLLAANPPADPTEMEIAAEFEQRREELRRPPRYTIEHVYFNRDREAEVEAVVTSIREQNLTPGQALEMSSPFLPGYRFSRQSPDQLARHFGAAFVTNLQQAGPRAGQWVGPVQSTYGQHLVWVSEIEPERDATLEEVRGLLQRDLESSARAEALAAGIARLRQHYEVIQ